MIEDQAERGAGDGGAPSAHPGAAGPAVALGELGVFAVVGQRGNPLPNVRHRRLFELLEPDVHYLYAAHPWRRWAQRNLFRWPVAAWTLRRLDRAGRIFWATNWRHLRHVRRCPVVLDLDDPTLARAEVAALRRAPNLAYLVVTTEALARRLEEAGVRAPTAVIANGFTPIASFQDAAARDACARERWVPCFGAESLRAVRVVYAATVVTWDDIRLALEAADALPGDPSETCWLFIGRASGFDPARVSRRNVAFLDILPHEDLQGYLAGAHVGLYPRTTDHGGRMHIKLVEYAAFGLAILGVQTADTDDAVAAGAMVGAPSDRFARMVVECLRDRDRLSALSARARVFAVGRDWPRLAARYAALFASVAASPGPGRARPPRGQGQAVSGSRG